MANDAKVCMLLLRRRFSMDFSLVVEERVHPTFFVAFSRCSEETMPKPDNVVPFAVPENTINALRRLRGSSKGLLAEKPVTEADQAVLRAVERTLNSIKNAQHLTV